MNIRKITALTLILSILNINIFTSVFAIENNKAKAKKQETKMDYVNLDWWKGFSDEYLEEYIVKAVENNHDLKIATQRVEQARQATNIQLGSELPTLSVGATPLLAKIPGMTSTEGFFSVPLIASYELDIFLKNRDKTRAMKKAYEAAKLQEKSAHLTVAGAVGTLYYNIVKLDKIIDLQNELITNREKIFELMKLSNQEGIVSTADMLRAEKSYIFAVSDMQDLKKARESALNAFCVLIGETPNNSSQIKRISYDSIAVNKTIPETISSEVIVERPDYLAAQKLLEKAKIDVRVAKKEFLPTIDIAGLINFSVTSLMGFNSMNWTNALAGLGLSGMLPVFTGGKRIANLKIQKSRYEEVLQNYYKTNLTSIQEVNDALSSLKLDDEKYQNNLKALNMENKDFEYSELKYESGVISYLDLIQRKESLLVIEKMVTSSKIDTYIDQIGLYKATAGVNL